MRENQVKWKVKWRSSCLKKKNSRPIYTNSDNSRNVIFFFLFSLVRIGIRYHNATQRLFVRLSLLFESFLICRRSECSHHFTWTFTFVWKYENTHTDWQLVMRARFYVYRAHTHKSHCICHHNIYCIKWTNIYVFKYVRSSLLSHHHRIYRCIYLYIIYLYKCFLPFIRSKSRLFVSFKLWFTFLQSDKRDNQIQINGNWFGRWWHKMAQTR